MGPTPTAAPPAPYALDLLDRLPLGVSVYRLEAPDDPASFRLAYANAAAGEITGLDVAREVGRPLVDVAPGVAASGLLDRYAAVVRSGEAADLGLVTYGDDRIAERTYQVDAVPVGERSVAAVFRDVSARAELQALRETREQLGREEDRFRTLFDAIADVVLVYPLTAEGPGPFVAFNQAALDLYGYSEDELRSMTVGDLVDPTRLDLAAAIAELRRTRRSTFESTHVTRDGRRVPVSTSAQLAEFDGRLCVIALCRDDAERRQFRRELARANLGLERTVAERTARAEAFAEDLKILHRITTAEHDSPEARYEAYLRAGCEMFDLPVGILSSTPTDPASGGRLYRIEAVVSPDPDLVPGLTVPLSEAFCDAVVERGATVVYADAAEEAPDHPACVGRGLRAFIGTPLRVDGEVVGTLNFVSPEPRAGGFDASERDLVEVMADAVARRLSLDRAEAAGTEARERYRSVVETVEAAVVVVDADARVVLANPSAREALGLTGPEGDGGPGGAGRWPVVDERGRPVPDAGLPERQALQTGEPIRGVVQGVGPPGGAVRWFRVNATPIDHDHDGRPDAVILSFLDVTDYREALAAARRSQGLLRSVLAASPDGVMAFRAVRDRAGAVVDFEWTLVNPRAAEIVGRDAGALVGRRLLDVFPGNREAGLFDAYVDVVESGTRYETVVPYASDGLDASFRLVAVPLPTEDGFTVSFADVVEAEPLDDGGPV